jgi:hypothetical protein
VRFVTVPPQDQGSYRGAGTVPYRIQYASCVGRENAVGIATGYGLDGPGIESRWGAKFSSHIQTGPVVHPASCIVGTGSSQG